MFFLLPFFPFPDVYVTIGYCDGKNLKTLGWQYQQSSSSQDYFYNCKKLCLKHACKKASRLSIKINNENNVLYTTILLFSINRVVSSIAYTDVIYTKRRTHTYINICPDTLYRSVQYKRCTPQVSTVFYLNVPALKGTGQ